MFDTNRQALQGLYQDGSMLSFESEQFMGIQAIMTKLTTLKFNTVSTLDSQPTPSGGIICFVTGKLIVDGDANPLM
eukprot:scaffold134217_cov39-Tisochrysis_lutea.AAC.1